MNIKFLVSDGAGVGGFWGKVIGLSAVLFFVYLGDGILSDWVPSFVQESLKSPLLMGLVISFSSAVGLLADLVFPQILKGIKTRRLFSLAIGCSLVFCGLLWWSVTWPLVVIFLISMGVWGIYYEFLGFGGQEFVSESIPIKSRASVWAVLGAFRSLAYFVGPLIGSYLALEKGNYWVVAVATACVVMGYLLWLVVGGKNRESRVVEAEVHVRLVDEVHRWWTLSEHVWPVLVLSLMLGVVDATYWTTGTVFSDKLAEEAWWGGLFLPLYTLPMVFVGVVMARWGIYRGKKKLAEWFMLVSGLLLALMSGSQSTAMVLVMSFFVGLLLSFSWPLTEAVYSDVVNRMGGEGKHMMGLSGSTISLAYVVGPIIAGLISQFVGEQRTFAVMGVVMFVVSLFLLVVTPRKLRLPQKEIKSWIE